MASGPNFGANWRGLAAAALLVVAGATTDKAEAQNWDGSGLIRFGVFLQGSFNDFDISQTPQSGVGGFRQTASPGGFGVGISSGYDLRLGSFVIGGEVDASFDDGSAKAKPTNQEQYGIDYLVTLRGRLGYLFHPGFMGYLTVGYGMLGTEYKLNGFGGTGNNGAKKNAMMGGVVYGAGFEYELGWGTAFLEYLHADVGDWDFNALATNNRVAVEAASDLVRLGLKFKVGHDYGHDVYRRGGSMK